MARKRRYGSITGDEVAPSSPFLESINLPDENYYRNMTESPMELFQPHMSTNPVKHGVSKTNMNNMLILQDKFNNMDNRTISKCNSKRTLIPQDTGGIHEMRNRLAYRTDNIDIINDDMPLRVAPGYNTRNRAKAIPKENIYRENEKVVKKRIEKGSSNLPPLPRTEDFWPKINRDGIQDHEDYLNSIRNKHLNKSKIANSDYYLNENSYKDSTIFLENNDSEFYRTNNYVREGIESIETPLKDLRSGTQKMNNVKRPETAESSIQTSNDIIDNKTYSHNYISRDDLTHIKKKNVRNALVGGDTPLRKLGFQEFFNIGVETSEIGVGQSPKTTENACNSKKSDAKLEGDSKCDESDISKKRGGSILRKSIDVLNESSKQVRFSTSNNVVDNIPPIKKLLFDPSDVPLIENYLNVADDTIGNMGLDEDKILDTLSVDSNIALRLVQLSKEEIRLFQQGLEDEENSKYISIDKDLMLKAVSGMHRYFLNKVFEYENSKDLQFQDIKKVMPDMRYYYDNKNKAINSERDELINKITMLNLNINKLTDSLQEVEEIKSRLLPASNIDNESATSKDEYIFKCTSRILEDKSTNNDNNITSPASSADTEIIPYKEATHNNDNIEELLNECNQSQFMQMECIAVLNDCMALLDDAEIGMQNFQRLLAKKAFDNNEDNTMSYNSNLTDSLEVVEDTLLRLQKGASITPRFSLEDTVNYRNSIASMSVGSIINYGNAQSITGKRS